MARREARSSSIILVRASRRALVWSMALVSAGGLGRLESEVEWLESEALSESRRDQWLVVRGGRLAKVLKDRQKKLRWVGRWSVDVALDAHDGDVNTQIWVGLYCSMTRASLATMYPLFFLRKRAWGVSRVSR